MVAQVTTDEPETAAKMVQPITLTCSRRLSHGARPQNMPWASLERNRISPIHRNSGKAVSIQLVVLLQMVSTMASPTGRSVKNCIAITATPSRDRPIHTEPSSTSMKTIRKSAIKASMAASSFDPRRFAGGCMFEERPPGQVAGGGVEAGQQHRWPDSSATAKGAWRPWSARCSAWCGTSTPAARRTRRGTGSGRWPRTGSRPAARAATARTPSPSAG